MFSCWIRVGSLRAIFFSAVAAAGLGMLEQHSASATQSTRDASTKAKTIEIPFNTFDGYPMLGKLTLPVSNGSHPLVIYVQTAEGMTVDMMRQKSRTETFSYFDLYRDKLPKMNVAFFSYEGRGIRMGKTPPRYETIDWDVYNTSTLENKVRDVLNALEVVRKQPGINRSRIFLMGASEGALLAAEAASRSRGKAYCEELSVRMPHRRR